jgi:DNA-binding transcriptional MerR regulator
MKPTDSEPRYLRVGDLARQTGKTVRAIHLYEELGLIEPATRSSGGFRLYHPTVVERVRWIDLLNGLGLSLHETQDIVERWWKSEHGPDAMEELRTLFNAKLDETRENIRRQQQLEHELVEGLAYLEACRVCGEPGTVDTCVACTHDHAVERAGAARGSRAPGTARAGWCARAW